MGLKKIYEEYRHQAGRGQTAQQHPFDQTQRADGGEGGLSALWTEVGKLQETEEQMAQLKEEVRQLQERGRALLTTSPYPLRTQKPEIVFLIDSHGKDIHEKKLFPLSRSG